MPCPLAGGTFNNWLFEMGWLETVLAHINSNTATTTPALSILFIHSLAEHRTRSAIPAWAASRSARAGCDSLRRAIRPVLFQVECIAKENLACDKQTIRWEMKEGGDAEPLCLGSLVDAIILRYRSAHPRGAIPDVSDPNCW